MFEFGKSTYGLLTAFFIVTGVKSYSLNYELKLGITPYEKYGSQSYSDRFSNGFDYGVEVYKNIKGNSFGFGGEVKRKLDDRYTLGDGDNLYAYYLLGKKEIGTDYSLVARLGRTSQDQFKSKYYGAIGIEKAIKNINFQVLYEQTKLENSFIDKNYQSVGLKIGYVFGGRNSEEKIEQPQVLLEQISTAQEEIPTIDENINIQLIENYDILGYNAYEVDIPEANREKLSEMIDSINQSEKQGIIELKGYTDNTGKKHVNQELTTKRIEKVKEFIENKGLSESVLVNKISLEVTLKEEYKYPNNSPEDRKLNRRVEVTFIENKE